MGSSRRQILPVRIVATSLVATVAFLGPGIDAVAAFSAPHSGGHHVGLCQAGLCRCLSGCPANDGERAGRDGGTSAAGDRSDRGDRGHPGGTIVCDHPDGRSLFPSPSNVPAIASWGVLTATQPRLELVPGIARDVPAARPTDRASSPSIPPPRAARG